MQTLVSLLLSSHGNHTNVEPFTVTKCSLKFDSQVSYCGVFESLVYGANFDLDRSIPISVSGEECRNMKSSGMFFFRGHNLEVRNTNLKNHQTFDIVDEGFRGMNGQCRGSQFVYQGIIFNNHVLR